MLKWIGIWLACGFFNVFAIALTAAAGGTGKPADEAMLAAFASGPLGTFVIFLCVIFSLLLKVLVS